MQFANSVPATGAVILCSDDPHLQSMREDITRAHSDLRIRERRRRDGQRNRRWRDSAAACTVRESEPGGRPVELGRLPLSVPGRHNVLNALAAVAMARELGIPFATSPERSARFMAPTAAFNAAAWRNGVTVVEDYGHHPTEIAAVDCGGQADRRRTA